MTSLLLLPLLILHADPAWELSAKDDGVMVYGRTHPGSDIREMKAMGLIEAPPKDVWAALRDYDHYTTTMPYTVEGKVVLRENGDKITYFYTRLDMPMVSNRDYIIKLVDESDWKDGKGFLKVTWSAANDKDALVPVKDGVVRVRVNDGYWLLEPREDGKQTFATYYVYTAPGGSIPNWIANKANGMAVPRVFQAIKNVVKKNQKK